MAFMALFGWIFLLMIPAFYIGMALEAVLAWGAAPHILVKEILFLNVSHQVMILLGMVKKPA